MSVLPVQKVIKIYIVFYVYELKNDTYYYFCTMKNYVNNR